MIHERQFDDLIRAAWEVIESDFDEAAFLKWRKKALSCFTDILGPDHPYTLSFQDYVQQAEVLSVLAGKGLLVAARERSATENMAQYEGQHVKPSVGCLESRDHAQVEDYRI